MKALHINAADKTVTAIDYAGLADLQRLVGGYIEIAYKWPNGDVLFVDEEGLLKTGQAFFSIAVRDDQTLAGNGVVVGPEIGDTLATRKPKITVDALRAMITWLD